MRVYIASHDRWAALYLKAVFLLARHEVVSTWHDTKFLPTSQMSDTECADAAERDIGEIQQSDCLCLISGPDRYSGGKFVEAGIAIGMGKPVCVLGQIENCLLHARHIMQSSTPAGAVMRLERAVGSEAEASKKHPRA
jgi:nucleoside 2-deoxyribosyltransferase